MADALPTLGLPSKRRLKTGRDFTVIRDTGRRLVRGCLVLNWLEVSGEDGGQSIAARSRLGVITSKRIGSAVTRNRARRMMREAFRLNQGLLRCPVDLVLVARPSIATKPFASIEKDLIAILRDAKLIQSPPKPSAGQAP